VGLSSKKKVVKLSLGLFEEECLLSLIENRMDECYMLLNKTDKEIYKKEMQVLYVIKNQIKGKEGTN
jgi:hypothetical protein